MNQKELLERIEKAAEEGATELDLSYNDLSELSPEIGQLTNLTGLDLRSNQLSELPAEIGKLTKLTELDLSRNQLSQLPPEIFQLTNLTRLNLNNNQLSELPAEIVILTNLITLDLGGNQLRELTPEIVRLTNLTTLNLLSNQLGELPPEIGALTYLIELDLDGNQLSELPAEFGKLTNLTTLDLSGNQLSELPEEIVKLTNLKTLYLSDNQLSQFPPEISQLANLTKLDLSDNQLSELPSEISQLTNLTKLGLRSNNLSQPPPKIGQLTNLTELDLGINQLSQLPSEISQLTNLTKLDLNNNQLSQLPPEITQLTNLKILHLSFNQLSQLPPEITQLSDLTTLNVHTNPLTSPPLEIAKQGVNAIQKYLAALEGESRILNEVKVLLVGDGGAGKTSLVKQVLGEAFDTDEPTTHGIRIRNWTTRARRKEIRVNIWDFGGQEIMHATHQFFLSKRSLYILVLDGRRDEKTEYWLQHIETFGGDSPVLVVLNKYDDNPAFDLNRPILQQKYPGIKGFYRTSCATGYGVASFRKALVDELAQVKLIETRWANAWFQVKQQLENLKEQFISYEQYEEICEEAGITESLSQEILVEFFHDLGVALHFKEFELEGTHVLDPRWVTGAVYKIINSGKVTANKGVLHLRDLRGILRRKDKAVDYLYPRDKHPFIIGIMKKFELCYDLARDDTVLIPQLLDVVEPAFEFDYETALKFILQYETLLPLSVMPRFLVNRNRDIKGELRWRTGVVLADARYRSTAVIRADNEARRIDIYVNGEQRKDYLATIRYTFQVINDSFEKLEVEERVPMPDDPEITVSYDHLLRLDRNNIGSYMPEGSERIYNIKELLGHIQPQFDLRALRRHLLREVPDVDFDAFCMDFWPKVYDKFGTTMGKDQKINFLLDHCRRDPALIERLVQLLRQEFPAFSI